MTLSLVGALAAAQSKKIKSAYDTFCADLKRELEEYDRLYSQLEAVQGELKTLHEEQGKHSTTISLLAGPTTPA